MKLQTGDTEQILFLVLTTSGQPATGLSTIRLRIQRVSDSLLFDFADDTFKASGHTTIDATMTEFDATNSPGIYSLVGGFDSSAITNPNTDDTYLLIPIKTSGSEIIPFPSALEVGQWADDIGKIDDFATTPPATALTGSLLDRVANKDGAKTYDQSTDSLEAISDKIDAHSGGGGARQVTIHVDSPGPADLPDVSVSIFNDTNTVFLTSGTTNSNGDYVTALDDGDYNVRLIKAGFTFTVPEPFTVSADATFDFLGAGVVIAAPSAPDLCVVFGTLRDAEGKPIPGSCIEVFAETPQVVAGTQKANRVGTTVTDVNGFFQIELVRNTIVNFKAIDADIDIVRTVPDAPNQDLTSWT